MSLFLILVPTLISLLAFYNFYWKRRKLPPGPTPLPFIGNARSMAKAENIFDLFHQWTKTYGPVHTFWMGEDPVVAVADYKLIEETFVKDGDAYAGRPMTANFPAFLRRGFRGIIVTQESLWREQRRFALHALREFGFGKNIIQERILEETTDLIANIKNDIKCGIKEHTITKYIDPAIGSIINALLFGYRFEGGKLSEFYELKKLLGEIVKTSRSPFTFAMQRKTEWLRYIPVFSSFYYKINQNIDRVFGFLERQVNEHLNEIDYNSEPTDFVDAYLRKKAKLDEEGSPHYYSMEQLLATIFDLWMAGQETTSTTLAYSIVFLILNQDAQQKLQAELDKVVGSSRLVTLEDRPKLNYTIAVVNEAQRLANIIAINVRHTTLKDVEILGYKLPKGTTIVPQISVVISDPKIFPEPEKFKPERFLDETGQLKKVDELIPFSIGRRQCLGESLARMELFLLIANIFNQFKITATPGRPPEVVRKLANTLAPPTFTCDIETRVVTIL